MLKKTFISSAIFIFSSSTLLAKPITYVGGGLGLAGYSQYGGLHGANVNVFAGRGTLLGQGKYYLGGEIGAAFYGRNTYAASASFIPGLMLTPSTMLYGRVGVGGGHSPLKGFNTYFNTVLGAGVQTSLTKNWGARIEYNTNTAASLGLVYTFD
jgi:opacity protein-like surface antigen